MNVLWIIGFLFAGIGLILGTGIASIFWLWRGAKGWRNIGRAIFLTLPDLAGTKATFTWSKSGYKDRNSREAGAIPGDKDRVEASGPASYASNWGPLHIMSDTGFSLVAPSKLEAAKTIEAVYVANWIADNKRLPNKAEAAQDGDFAKGLQKAMNDAARLAKRFQVWDPLAYWKKSRESVMAKLYHSIQGERHPWYATVILIGMVILAIAVFAVLGVLMVKVVPALAPKPAAIMAWW